MTLAHTAVRDAIRYTIAAYNLNGDALHYDRQVEVFHPEAEMMIQSDRVLIGVDAIITGLKVGAAAREAHLPAHFQRHHLTTSAIDVLDDDTAQGRHCVFVVTELGFDHSGFYTDHYARLGERWVIKRRQATMEWARPDSRFVRWLGKVGRTGLVADRT